jgi:hypothetical protein
MSPQNGDGGWRRFEENFREWVGRDTRTAPERAAQRVLERLPAREGALAPWRIAAAAVLTLAALGAIWWGARGDHPVSTAVGSVMSSPVLQEGVVLWWIEPNTPVYFVLGPPGPETGGVR